MDRISAINLSLNAFIWGLIGLLPVIGLLPAVHALGNWQRVRRLYRDWNPAADYLKWGALLGLLGLLGNVLAIGVIVVAIFDSVSGGGSGCIFWCVWPMDEVN